MFVLKIVVRRAPDDQEEEWMNVKKSLLVMVCLLVMCCLSCAWAEEEPVKYTAGDFLYVLLEDGTAGITGYRGYDAVLAIPGEMDGHAVTEIGEGAFYLRDSLTDITIPDSVTEIGEGAFYGCENLTEITIPDSVSVIGAGAFSECADATLVVGSGSYAEAYAQENGLDYTVAGGEGAAACNPADFTYVLLEDGTAEITGYKGEAAELVIPREVDGYVVTVIGEEAFVYCGGLVGVTIPDTVTVIDNSAFYWCKNLTGVSIPDSVERIGWYAFLGCSSLTEMTIPDNVVKIDGNAFDSCKNLTLTVGRGSYAEEYAKGNGIAYTYPDSLD